MITTVSDSQTTILRNIMQLYNGGEPFEADLTWGGGQFYRELPAPRIRMDLEQKAGANLIGDARAIPLVAGSIGSVVFDPPFIHAPGKDSIMGQRFGGYQSQFDLRAMYLDSLRAIYRVLAPHGLLVFKCQDCVESGKQNFNHIHVHYYATHSYAAGLTGLFTAEDLFILTRKNVIRGHNHGRQVHARKTHSYFWCFRKVGA